MAKPKVLENADLENMLNQWDYVKKSEAMIKARRQELEDEISLLLELPDDLDGTENYQVGNFKVKVTGRLNQKVDIDMISNIAEEENLIQQLNNLFRFKAEINKTSWKMAAAEITGKFLPAITTTPGRPTYSVELKEQGE